MASLRKSYEHLLSSIFDQPTSIGSDGSARPLRHRAIVDRHVVDAEPGESQSGIARGNPAAAVANDFVFVGRATCVEQFSSSSEANTWVSGSAVVKNGTLTLEGMRPARG